MLHRLMHLMRFSIPCSGFCTSLRNVPSSSWSVMRTDGLWPDVLRRREESPSSEAELRRFKGPERKWKVSGGLVVISFFGLAGGGEVASGQGRHGPWEHLHQQQWQQLLFRHPPRISAAAAPASQLPVQHPRTRDLLPASSVEGHIWHRIVPMPRNPDKCERGVSGGRGGVKRSK